MVCCLNYDLYGSKSAETYYFYSVCHWQAILGDAGDILLISTEGLFQSLLLIHHTLVSLRGIKKLFYYSVEWKVVLSVKYKSCRYAHGLKTIQFSFLFICYMVMHRISLFPLLGTTIKYFSPKVSVRVSKGEIGWRLHAYHVKQAFWPLIMNGYQQDIQTSQLSWHLFQFSLNT